MADIREEYLTELYIGFKTIANTKEFKVVTYPEFKARMQGKSTDELRKELAVLRSVIKKANGQQ